MSKLMCNGKSELWQIQKTMRTIVQTEKIETLGRPFSIISNKPKATTKEFDAFHGFILIKNTKKLTKAVCTLQ